MTISFWRDVSVVLLVVEAFIFALVPLVVLYFTNKGFRRLRSLLQPLFPQILHRVRQVERVTVGMSGRVVTPIIVVYAWIARIRSVTLAVIGLLRVHLPSLRRGGTQ